MKVEYIYHSSFTVETENYFLVFDYFKGDINLKKNKKTIVFSTHGHPDHYNPQILKWLEENSHILYVFSSDIKTNPSTHIYIMEPDETLKLFDIEIESFGSTDLGLSFLVKVDNKTIFFAGDLNWWYWDEDSDEEKISMEKAFKAEVEKLINMNIDVVFFPVDPRLDDNYYLGGKYIIEKVMPKAFFPMHFGDKYEVTKDFIHKMNSTTTNIVEISKKNEVFELKTPL